MKICKKCKTSKNLEEYYNMKLNKDGKSGKCKEWTKKDVRRNSEKVGDKYESSEKGVVRVIYKTMKRNNKLRGFGEMPFSKEDLSSWLYNNNNFKNLYDNWIKSGKDSRSKPSVDRLDDFKGYQFDNMSLVTWKDNKDHQTKDILTGVGTSGNRCSNVGKYDLHGNLIKTYVSYQEVRRVEGYCVHYPVKNNYPCKNGYVWKLL